MIEWRTQFDSIHIPVLGPGLPLCMYCLICKYELTKMCYNGECWPSDWNRNQGSSSTWSTLRIRSKVGSGRRWSDICQGLRKWMTTATPWRFSLRSANRNTSRHWTSMCLSYSQECGKFTQFILCALIESHWWSVSNVTLHAKCRSQPDTFWPFEGFYNQDFSALSCGGLFAKLSLDRENLPILALGSG